jgi:hypothetical protein
MQKGHTLLGYLNQLALTLRSAGQQADNLHESPELEEAKEVLEQLAGLMVSFRTFDRNLPSVHRSIAELCRKTGDQEGVRTTPFSEIQTAGDDWEPRSASIIPLNAMYSAIASGPIEEMLTSPRAWKLVQVLLLFCGRDQPNLPTNSSF